MKLASRFSRAFVAVFGIFLLGAVLVIGQNYYSRAQISEEFKAARLAGTSVSADIVSYSNSLSDSLKKINELEQEGRVKEALAATEDLTKRAQELRGKAIELSKQLEIMAGDIPKISSAEARQAALDSIASRLAVISRLANYSNYLGDLLSLLRERFATGAYSEAQITATINQINMEVVAINNFDKNASDAMSRFDRAISGE